MIRHRLCALACVAVAFGAAGPSLAQDRCALIGQVATSAFLQFASALSSGGAAQVDAASARLADLTATYTGLGCDPAALGRAMDCVLAGSGSGNTRDIARACLATEGLAASPN